jgi:hypothetical protein
VGYLREREHTGDPGVYERMILKWNFKKFVEGHGMVCFCSQGTDSWCTTANKVKRNHSDSIK